ncbi:MAG TPA: ribonuclease III [Gaiellaceae bacterium]|nr:ribonuclease III [Gaiellaceae bacterium]
MRRRSRRSGKLSTTSPRTNKHQPSLAELIDALPPARAASAFTHTSWAGERSESYERLEFLGDSVLELALAHELYRRFPDFNEGQMAKIRSHVVSRASCAVVARELGLGERLLAAADAPGSGELARLAGNRNVLAAVLEAIIAALYLEHGFEQIAPAVVAAFESRIEYALTNQVDHKTDLQETLARSGRSVSYALLNAEGPPHDRTFTAAAVIDGEEAGVGRGASKKAAEQNAAREALLRISEAASGEAPESPRSG